MENPITLYLGLDLPDSLRNKTVIHHPIIQIVTRPHSSNDIQTALTRLTSYTHLIFTSKSSVRILLDILPLFGWSIKDLSNMQILAVGQSTAKFLYEKEINVTFVAKEETAEGIVTLLNELPLNNASIFWPHSALSRRVIADYLDTRKLSYRECILYDTIPSKTQPKFDLREINEIIFTSPSTIDAFLQIYREFPAHTKLTTIGPITEAHLLSSKAKQSK